MQDIQENTTCNQWAFTCSSNSYGWYKPCLNALQLAQMVSDHQYSFLKQSKAQTWAFNQDPPLQMQVQARDEPRKSRKHVVFPLPLRLPLAGHTAQNIILTYKNRPAHGYTLLPLCIGGIYPQSRRAEHPACVQNQQSRCCCCRSENMNTCNIFRAAIIDIFIQ